MCGIFCLFGFSIGNTGNKLRHRGPDDFKVKQLGKCHMEFSRLSINDTSKNGMQPFHIDDKLVMCNGEIYNHKELSKDLDHQFKSSSDCEFLIPYFKKHDMMRFWEDVRGVFAICYSDGESVQAIRDPIGVRPLFYTRPTEDSIAFASEMKALKKVFVTKVEIFPPGHMYDSRFDMFTCYYNYNWTFPKSVELPNPYDKIRKTFIQAVERRVKNTDRQVCCLLSGGLDSSLVAAVAKMFVPKLKTFSIGTKDSPDCAAARKVAEYLGTNHTEVEFDIDNGISSLPNVIHSLESYDTTTVRASTPMWLLAKHISEKTPYRVVLSGEGSDELLGGYLYFHYAPSVQEFFNENIRRLKLLHQFDVLRSDRTISAHGLEVRVPFLDVDFIDTMMTIDQSLKFIPGQIEKWILRKAFEGYLPDEILWRQKDAFSDAVGYSWVGELKRNAEFVVTDDIENNYEHNKPLTKEELMYRELFKEEFGDGYDHLITEMWRPKWTNQTDPSATLLDKHLKKSDN